MYPRRALPLPQSRPPPAPLAFAVNAPVAPLPAAIDGHYYLRRSGVSRRLSQSESSASKSDREEGEESDDDPIAASSSSGGERDDATSDASDSDSSEDSFPSTHGSLSSRSASESSLSDPYSSGDDDVFIIHDPASSYTTRVMSVHGGRDRAFWQTDNLGVVALLVPITGLSTMFLTEVLACYNHFDCSTHYPTLSYAAEFKPEGHAFTLGMCLTSIFVGASFSLFGWFVQLKLVHPAVDRSTVIVVYACHGVGFVTSAALFGLAVFDMGAYHDIHVTCTIVFFVMAWVTITFVQAGRRKLMRDEDLTKCHRGSSVAACAQLGAASTVRIALSQWKRMRILDAYRIGRVFLYAGLTATALFGLLFLCVNGMLPNPFGFTAIQEALLEAFAIVCQLLFMGTISCELSKLTRVVEHRDYEELERAE